MIAAGGNPNAISRSGWTALYRAGIGFSSEVVRTLLDSGALPNLPGGCHALHAAAAGGWSDVVFALAGGGADVNSYNEKDDLPLTIALRKKQISKNTILILLAYGADVERRNKAGENALELFATVQDTKIVEMIANAKHGVRPDIKNFMELLTCPIWLKSLLNK